MKRPAKPLCFCFSSPWVNAPENCQRPGGQCGCPRHGCRGQAPWMGSRRPRTAHPPGQLPAIRLSATTQTPPTRGCAVGRRLPGAAHCPLWKRSHNNATQHAPRRKSAKTLAGSHFYTALILINGLVVIGLHNGGPFGTARRQSMQREGRRAGAVLIQRVQGAGNCHWGAAAAQVPTGSGRRLRLRGWGRNRPPLSEWGSSITTSSHFPLNVGKSL